MGNHYDLDLAVARQHPEFPVVHAYTTRMMDEHDAGAKATMEYGGIPYQPPAIAVIRDHMIDGAAAYAVANFETDETLNAQQVAIAGLQAVPDEAFYKVFDALGATDIEPSAARILIQAQTATTLRQLDSTALSASAKPIKDRINGAYEVAVDLGITPVDVFVEETGYRAFVRAQTTPTEVALQQLALRTLLAPQELMRMGHQLERDAAIIIDRLGPTELEELEADQAEDLQDPAMIAEQIALSQSLIVGSTVHTLMELERFWGPQVVGMVPKDIRNKLVEPIQPQRTRPQQPLQIGDLRIIGANEEQADILRMRQAFVNQYFEERGWDATNPTIEQIMEVRNQPGWQNPL